MKEILKAIKGFSRVQLEESGKIVGDSGWTGPNTITNSGFIYYLQRYLAGSTGTANVAYPKYCILGSGGLPNVTDISLPGEVWNTNWNYLRQLVAYSSSGSKTANLYVTFYGSSFVHTNSNSLPIVIQNIGLYGQSVNTDVEVGTELFCGNTYTTSSWATNQNVNATYSIQLS